ncbi:MAG: hypothetical protein GY755_07510 [Chloroflexi bacterium]|nr:hypothetical protein [Chloroflexota bacterium]
MAEKKNNKLKQIMPNIILVVVLVCAVLIILDVSSTLIDEGVGLFDQPDPTLPVINQEVDETPSVPLPTPEPIEDA